LQDPSEYHAANVAYAKKNANLPLGNKHISEQHPSHPVAISFPGLEDYQGHHKDLYHHINSLNDFKDASSSAELSNNIQNTMADKANRLNTGSDKTHIADLKGWRSQFKNKGMSQVIDNMTNSDLFEDGKRTNATSYPVGGAAVDTPRGSAIMVGNSRGSEAHEHQHAIEQHVRRKYGDAAHAELSRQFQKHLDPEILKRIHDHLSTTNKEWMARGYPMPYAPNKRDGEVMARALDLGSRGSTQFSLLGNLPKAERESLLKRHTKSLENIREWAKNVKPEHLIKEKK
jgi:hypothetical protein